MTQTVHREPYIHRQKNTLENSPSGIRYEPVRVLVTLGIYIFRAEKYVIEFQKKKKMDGDGSPVNMYRPPPAIHVRVGPP